MTIDELFKELEDKVRDTVIVTLKYKYDFEEKYTIENHILEYEAYNDSYFWLNDWYEGQTDIEVLGYMLLCEVDTTKLSTCEDCISREDVINIIEDVCPIYSNDYRYILEDKIAQLPSVTSWSDWIPATQLPEPNTAVLLYVRYKSSSQRTYQLGMWNDNKQAWEDWRTPYQLEEEFEIIKWMELPEGYEEDKHE